MASAAAGAAKGAVAPGLRERKKARTRAEIQRHALRLFKRQGYDETTIERDLTTLKAVVERSPAT